MSIDPWLILPCKSEWMMDWKIDEPPIGEPIEFETDAGDVRQGVLARAGTFGMGRSAQEAAARQRQQYMIEGEQLELIEVRRWRYLPD